MSDSAQFQEEKPSHQCRTEIPNFVEDNLSDPYEFRVYMRMKRRAGDGGSCTESTPKMARACGMSERKFQGIKARLAQPYPQFENRPLIKVESRLTNSGDPDTDLITIICMWDLNFQKFYGGARDAGGVAHEMRGGGAGGADKEEPPKKNPKEELFVADDPVGSPPSRISVLSTNNQKVNVTTDDLYLKVSRTHPEWNVEEIQYAWKALAKYKGVVHDWWGFIEGTVEKYKNQLKSKRASGEKVSKDSKHKSQTRSKGPCKKTLQKKQDTCKNSFSENGSLEQLYQGYRCLTDFLEKSPNGLPNQQTS